MRATDFQNTSWTRKKKKEAYLQIKANETKMLHTIVSCNNHTNNNDTKSNNNYYYNINDNDKK